MLSRLIITFLCAAAIGSVSGAFLTFDPDPIVLKDADISTSVSVQLKSKPAEAVTVYFESPSTFMSTCTPLTLGNKQRLTRNFSQGSSSRTTSADLSSTDVLKITQASKDLSHCRIGDNIVNIFDSLDLLFSKPGWYQMVSTGDIEVQILWSECGAGLKCFPAVVFRYGPTVMSLDTRGPVKGIGEYPMTEVTPNTSGVRHERENEVDAFFRSWGIKDENVLTNPDTRASIPPLQQPGTICKFPKDPPPKPVDPVPTTTTGTTTAATTAATTTTATTTAATTAATTTAATTSSTTSTTATALYSASTVPSTTSTTTSSTSLYIHSHQLQVKQAYLAKCRTLTDDMILDPTKEVIDQGNQIRKEYGFGNVTCINSCSGKGTCTDFGCACSPGFSGMDCSMDLTKANQYDPTVDQYRINVNITVIQEQMEQHSKLPGICSICHTTCFI
ncbi:hypothetical protein BASA62_002708 [Batrachochytrium salamandrivorans]|nr:hypothetical protein BASA62_002708 [Batrachochytrium salamandrivorans]